jgi:hypothetical protein
MRTTTLTPTQGKVFAGAAEQERGEVDARALERQGVPTSSGTAASTITPSPTCVFNLNRPAALATRCP